MCRLRLWWRGSEGECGAQAAGVPVRAAVDVGGFDADYVAGCLQSGHPVQLRLIQEEVG